MKMRVPCASGHRYRCTTRLVLLGEQIPARLASLALELELVRDLLYHLYARGSALAGIRRPKVHERDDIPQRGVRAVFVHERGRVDPAVRQVVFFGELPDDPATYNMAIFIFLRG